MQRTQKLSCSYPGDELTCNSKLWSVGAGSLLVLFSSVLLPCGTVDNTHA